MFADLARRGHLRGLTGERFAEGAVRHISELNAAHPFRDRNGRAMRLHLSQLAAQAGHALDMTRMPGPAWIEASIRGFKGDERPLAQVVAGALAPERWLRPAAALAELRDTADAARQRIQAATRTVRDRLTSTGASGSVKEVIASYRTEVERLDAAGTLAAPLAALTDADGAVPVRAAVSASARDRAHAILAAAEGLPGGLAPVPAQAALDAVRNALRAPPSPDGSPWDAALTPLGPRLDAHLQRMAARAARAGPPPPLAPGTDPEPSPTSAAPKPSRNPGPGF